MYYTSLHWKWIIAENVVLERYQLKIRLYVCKSLEWPAITSAWRVDSPAGVIKDGQASRKGTINCGGSDSLRISIDVDACLEKGSLLITGDELLNAWYLVESSPESFPAHVLLCSSPIPEELHPFVRNRTTCSLSHMHMINCIELSLQ